MTLDLNAERQIEWAKPTGCPAGFETLEVYAGRSDAAGGSAIELAYAKWLNSERVSRDALAKLHQLRVNKRATPVVLAVELGDGTVVTFGPNASAAPLEPLSAEQAQRLFQAVLDEPTALMARARLAALSQAIDSTTIPGVKNSGLFANHELRVGVPQRADWEASCIASTPLLAARGNDLIAKLGYSVNRAGAHALVLTGKGPRPQAIAVMLDETEAFDSESKRFSISPVAYGLTMAEKEGVPWLIMARGSQLRLYPARVDLGVGRKGLAETFFEVDLPHLTLDNAGYLTLLFSADALADGGTTFQIMESSAQYAVALGERLRDKVYEEIIPDLSLAVADQMVELGYEMDAAGLDLAYQITLRIFFRLLFQVYAEDRKLLPYKENDRYTRNALKTVAHDLVEDPDQEFDAESATLWDDLAQVWNVIDTGDRSWGVPPYNGGLFASDPELNEHGALIARLRIHNDVMGPVLRAMLLDESDDGEVGPIDFRSLSVREFGTIYEGLLESSLGLAEVDLTLDDKGTWLPAKKKSDEIYAYAGQVYFHNTSGQRKGTGSYFTPSFVVEHLLERSLDPALGDHLSRVAELLKAGDQAGAADLFFDFKVADLAMGSGHFLTAAIDHIEAKMAAFLAEDGHAIPGVINELSLLYQAVKEAIGPDAPEPEPSSLLRRQIARRCVYGLDINPIAVELARVSIWIHTFVRGLPMSSLDNNLVCANSLTGIGSVEEALDVLVPKRKGQGTIFDVPIEEALEKAKTVLVDVALMPELNRTETRAASKAVQRARKEAETARLLFDAAVLRRIGREDLSPGVSPTDIAEAAGREAAQEAIAALQPAHMPVLFPEVFLRKDGGFDVLIGNPPWDKVRHEPTQFWVQKSPGLHAERDRDKVIEKLRKQYPLFAAEEDREIASRELLRSAVKAHFKLQGSGHHELSKFFAERNLQLMSATGSLGLVLPGPFCALDGWKEIRRSYLRAHLAQISQADNRHGYLFAHVHQQTTVALVVLRPASQERVEVTPGLVSLKDFQSLSRVLIDVSDLVDIDDGAQVPWIGSPESAAVLSTITASPSLASGLGWVTGGPDTRWDFSGSGRNKGLATANLEPGAWKVLMTRHVLPYALSSEGIQKFVPEGSLRKLVAVGELESDGQMIRLPLGAPRIIYRFPSRSTDTRTLIAAPTPDSGFIYSTGYAHGVRLAGDIPDRDVLALLGVMNSIPCDWWSRKLVDRHVGSRIIRSLPVPNLSEEHRQRLAELAATRVLQSGGEDFSSTIPCIAEFALAATSAEEVEAEIDAIVAAGFGLSRDQVEHIFATFHRGWDYKPRLEAVLVHFDRIEASK